MIAVKFRGHYPGYFSFGCQSRHHLWRLFIFGSQVISDLAVEVVGPPNPVRADIFANFFIKGRRDI
jgi:hypothetical protein